MGPKGERFNTVSHLLGVVLAFPATYVLVRPTLLDGDVKKTVGFLIYGVTLVLGYLTSTLFHYSTGDSKVTFRRYDRIAIYFLIAGSYTPIMLMKLPPVWGWPILLTTWAMAIIATIIECRPDLNKDPKSVELYVLMGWMAVPTVKPLLETLTLSGVMWLFAGGLIYTLGAATVRWQLVPRYHEVWHVTVLLGSACHFSVMYFYIL